VVLKLTAGALLLPPAPVPRAPETDASAPPAPDARVALVNSEGRLLLFPAREVPELPRGKGNKLFGIATKKAESREELLVAMCVLSGTQSLAVSSGERQMKLTLADLRDYLGERAQRGAMLPRGWRTVERIEPVE